VEWETAAREHADIDSAATPEFWRETLARDPEIMHRLLGDLWNAAQAAKGNPSGRVSTPTVDEVFRLVIPEYSTLPFPEALKEKLEGRSIRWLAGQIHLHHSHVHRWVTGARPIVNLHDPVASMQQIESIAQALNVHAAYFAEWRRLWILLLLDDAFSLHPNLSIGVWKKFSGVGSPANGRSR
jgi:hypothetical protein